MSGGPRNTDVEPLDLIVAEDDFSIGQVIVRLLSGSGHTVRLCTDGQAALHAARERKPQAVLSDYQMPNLDGVGLARALADDPELSGIPMVLLTARGHKITDEELAGTRVIRIVGKPFGSRDIERVLAELADQMHGRAA